MKKLLILLIFACCLLFVVACGSSSAGVQNENGENNKKTYTVDLNNFEESNAEKTITFDKNTKTVTVKGELVFEAVYAYLGLDISDYNIIRIKYKVLGDYGFHLIPDYDDESVEWEDKEKNYCPSNLTEMVFPFIEGQTKLNGISLRGPWNGASTKFTVDSITFEKVSNPVKTDVYASNEPPVIDTATRGTIDANLSAWDFVKTTGAGFQYSPLGFGPSDYEWGMDNYHPAEIAKPSKAMINLIKEKGFKTVRLQTNSGHGMILDKDYTVNPSYIKAIKEVVDWCIEKDLNVIICGPFAEHTVNPVYIKKIEEGNIHYAGYYVNEDYKAESLKFIEAVWKQYAQAFNNSYDEHLIFETFNEPMDVFHDHAWLPKSDCADCQKDFAILNEYNQLIVDTVRSTGGNNASRFIMIESLAANAEALADDLFKLPDDEAQNKLIPTFHFYQMGGAAQYSSMYYTDSIKQKALDIFELLDEAYFSKKIPVYITEIGAARSIPILERINCMKDFMAEVKKSNRSCGTILHSDNDVKALVWFHCYYDCWKLKWFDEEFIDTYIYGANNQVYVLSDEFIKENVVKVESIVGKNLLEAPVEIRGKNGSANLNGNLFIRSRPENYKLEFEVETLSTKARIHLAYNDYKGNWNDVMARENVSLLQGGTLDNVMIMVTGSPVVVSIDNATSCEFETGGELYILGEDIIIKSIKVVE